MDDCIISRRYIEFGDGVIMADWLGYFAVENLNMNDNQKDTLVAELRQLGPSPETENRPNHLCHWRTRLDNEAAIFEARFNEDALTVEAFTNRLANIFGVDPSTIDVDISQLDFAGHGTTVAVFARTGTNYLRMALFGTKQATWDESHEEVLAYLASNLEAWENASS